MPAEKRRLPAGAVETSVRPSRQIDSFGKISKSPLPPGKPQALSMAKRRSSIALSSIGSDEAGESPSKKQRRVLDLADSSPAVAVTQLSAPERTTRAWKARRRPDDAPTKGAGASQTIHVDKASSATPSEAASGPGQVTVARSDASESSRESSEARDDDDRRSRLPEGLCSLEGLFRCFLTTVSIHHAHHGILSPLDLRVLLPQVAQSWGKRAVTEKDIRRILGLLQAQTAAGSAAIDRMVLRLQLIDYGGGKICVETSEDLGLGVTLGQALDHDVLRKAFGRNLLRLWTTARKDASETSVEDSLVTAFIDGLPLASVELSSSLAKITPILAKGQRRLQDFKAIAASRKENEALGLRDDRRGRGSRATVDRGNDLLARIRAKQQQRSELPAPPSPAALARTAALERLEEIVPVLAHLSTSSGTSMTESGTTRAAAKTPQRVSTPLPTLVQNLQNSLANPLSAEEAEQALSLLASDVAPEWVDVVRVGKVAAVVIDRRSKPAEEHLRARIRDACEKVREH